MDENGNISMKDWQTAIAGSPNLGYSLMKNVDLETFPGSIKVGRLPLTLFHASYASNFTADASTDICTSSATVPATGTAVVLTTTGTLPAGLTTSTTYFIIKLSDTTFKLATTITNAEASTAINITDAGTGTHTVTTINPGTVKHIVRMIDPSSNTRSYYFMQDSNGRVWYVETSGTVARLLTGNTLTSSSGNGIALFTNSDASAVYLFAFRNSSIDVCNVTTEARIEDPVGTSSWSNSWQSVTNNSQHYVIVGQDNIIYFCNGRYVGSIAEKPGAVFAPGTATTYTYNTQALDLPQSESAEWLEELGIDLLIAGKNSNKIYPWNRIDDSFRKPITVQEVGVYRMKNIGETVYVLAGVKGRIYTTNGTTCNLFKTIPEYVTNNAGTPLTNTVTWGGIGSRNGALIFGVFCTNTSSNSGLYMLTQNGNLTIENQPSTGAANVTAIYSEDDTYRMGYASGADYLDATARYTNFESLVHSPLYQVADRTEKGTLSEVELQIARPVVGGVRISYRRDTVSSFTTLTTITTDTSNTSYDADIGLTDLENVQFLVEFHSGVEIMEILFKK